MDTNNEHKVASTLYYDVHLDAANLSEDVHRVLVLLRPAWNLQDELVTVNYTEGKMNTLMRCSVTSDVTLDDALIVRVFNEATFAEVLNRQSEILAMRLAHLADCAQPILAVFRNGIVARYAKGRTLTMHDLNNPDMINPIARKLARFHCIDYAVTQLTDPVTSDIVYFQPTEFLEDFVQQTLSNIPEKLADPKRDEVYQKYKIGKEVLKKKYDDYYKLIDELGIKIQLNHSDFHIKNIVYDESTGEFNFIDFEGTGARLGCYDLIYMKAMHPMMLALGMIPSDSPPISDESWTLWRHAYLDAIQELHERDVTTIPFELHELFEVELDILSARYSVESLILMLGLLNEEGIPVDPIDLISTAYEKYQNFDGCMPELASKYRDMRKRCDELGWCRQF